MRQLIKSELCKTMDLGVGGTMLKWLDEAGAILAFEEAGGRVVTIKFSEVLFKIPVRERDIVKIYGSIGRVGSTSLSVDLEAENVASGQVVCSAEVTFVHVDDQGNKKPIPEERRKRIIDKYDLRK